MTTGKEMLLAAALMIALHPGEMSAAQQTAGSVAGTVSIASADGQSLVMPGVTITMTCAGIDPKVEVSNDQGEFRFADAAAGTCSLVADLQGFKSAVMVVTVNGGEAASAALVLALDTLREEVTVSGRSGAVAESPIEAHVERMTAQMMQTAPIVSERFQDALPLIPGVVRGPDGLLNISGSRSNRAALLFNNADGTDPVTGEDAIDLPIDAVSVVQVRGAAYAPEFGLSAGAVTTVETLKAGDAWHVTVNDLEPRLRRRGGEFRGIESFTPRMTIDGPIVRGKLSLLESIQYEYSQTRVFGLPPFESDTKVQGGASYTRADWTPSSTNHAIASAMFSPRTTTYAG